VVCNVDQKRVLEVGDGNVMMDGVWRERERETEESVTGVGLWLYLSVERLLGVWSSPGPV
jgi:hypothetical protein